MQTETQKTLQLPSGEKVGVTLPNKPNRDVRARMLAKCKFHIPLRMLQAKLDQNLWPTTGLLSQKLGESKIPQDDLWTGTEAEWKAEFRKQDQAQCEKRADKLRTLRKAQNALRKISTDEWNAIKGVLLIQRQIA